MKGYQIFVHALRMVFGNFGPVMRLTLGPVALLLVGGGLILGTVAGVTAGGGGEALGALLILVFAVFAAVMVFWVIVAWHRFVLLEVYPADWFPPWPGPAVYRYIGKVVVLSLVVFLILIPAMLISAGFTMASPALGVLFNFGLTALSSYLFYRFGVVLPAAAIDAPMGFGEAWRLTRDPDGGIVVLVLISAAFSTVLQVAALGLAATGMTVLPVAFGVFVGWLNLMVGASVLTTLYGHYVDGRAIG